MSGFISFGITNKLPWDATLEEKESYLLEFLSCFKPKTERRIDIVELIMVRDDAASAAYHGRRVRFWPGLKRPSIEDHKVTKTETKRWDKWAMNIDYDVWSGILGNDVFVPDRLLSPGRDVRQRQPPSLHSGWLALDDARKYEPDRESRAHLKNLRELFGVADKHNYIVTIGG